MPETTPAPTAILQPTPAPTEGLPTPSGTAAPQPSPVTTAAPPSTSGRTPAPSPALSSSPVPAATAGGLPVLTLEEMQAARALAEPRLSEAGLTNLRGLDENLIIDMRYATDQNFMGKRVYPSDASFLRPGTAQKLADAQAILLEAGVRIMVLDAYRPKRYQQILYDLATDKSYVAKGVSRHNRGAAVDVTLADMDGRELPMPSGYDEMTQRATRAYAGCTKEEAANRKLLTQAMVEAGFTTISNEWWHFDDPDYAQYAPLDEDL